MKKKLLFAKCSHNNYLKERAYNIQNTKKNNLQVFYRLKIIINYLILKIKNYEL